MGGAVGASIGGSVALLLFASPIPGLPTLVWGATLYLIAIPLVLLAEAVGEIPFLAPIFQLAPYWPAAVTGLLAALAVLLGSALGERAYPDPRTQAATDRRLPAFASRG